MQKKELHNLKVGMGLWTGHVTVLLHEVNRVNSEPLAPGDEQKGVKVKTQR